MEQSFNPVRLFGEATLIVALTECLALLAPPVLTPGLGAWGGNLVTLAVLALVSGPAVYWRCVATLHRLTLTFTGPADTKASTAMVALLLRFTLRAQPSPP